MRSPHDVLLHRFAPPHNAAGTPIHVARLKVDR